MASLRRPLVPLAVALVLTVALSGCSIGPRASAVSSNADGTTTIRYQGWAGQVLLPELAADLGYLGKVRLKWVGNTISGPQDIQSAATGQTDFGGAFTGAVVKLIEAGAPVTGVINYYGSDARSFVGFFARADRPIRSPRDLIDKKIAVNALGAHDEAVIDSYLTKGGLSPSDIRQVQLVVVPPNNTEEAIRQRQVDVGALSGVLQDHAIAAGGLRSVFADYAIFGPFDGGQYVLRNDFIKQNPQAARAFVAGVAKAIEWERTTPRRKVIAELTKILNARGRNENAANLQYWKSVGIPSRGGVVSDRDFTQWGPWLAASGIVSGPLKPSKYFTNEFNPYAGSSK